jgi:putative intracellular protease/amidase
VLAKLMAKNPAERYQTPAEAAAALAPLARGAAAVPVPLAEVVEETTQPIAKAVTIPTGEPGEVFAFGSKNDVSIPDGPTLVEAPRPRLKRSQPRSRTRKWLAIVGVALFGLLAGVVIRQATKKSNDGGTDTTDSKAPGNTGSGKAGTPPVVPAKTTPPKVLFVLPTIGVWMPDYKPVRERLEKNGAKVVTAGLTAQDARSAFQTGVQMESIPIEVVLTPEFDVADYSAVIFCGRNVSELTPYGRGGNAVRGLLDKMKAANKPVGAICIGQDVLIEHGCLRDKPAALNPQLQEKHPSVKWEPKSVVVSGKVVTGGTPESAVEFADTLLRVIRGE